MPGVTLAAVCKRHDQASVSGNGPDEKLCGGLEVSGEKRRGCREERSLFEGCRFGRVGKRKLQSPRQVISRGCLELERIRIMPRRECPVHAE